MKTTVALLMLLVSSFLGLSQGTFLFYNHEAPTRIGSPSGPFAGPGFWGQALVGTNVTNTVPVGSPREHRLSGIIPIQTIQVPFAEPYTFAQVQMAAWDGTLWGTDFASVPADQLGLTDIVPVWLVDPLYPIYYYPEFTQPAIIPIPEPTAVALTFVCVIALACRPRLGRRKLPLE